MSFHRLFEMMSLKSAHWLVDEGYVGELIDKAKSEDKKLFHYLEDFDCMTQMDVCLDENLNFWPQIDLYREIYEQYPEALFVLNKRPAKHILRSFKKWGTVYERIITYSAIKNYRGANTDEKILNWIDDHFSDVHEFFRDKENYIEFNIESDSIEALRKPLNIPPHIKEFPHSNKNKVSVLDKIKLWRKTWRYRSV